MALGGGSSPQLSACRAVTLSASISTAASAAVSSICKPRAPGILERIQQNNLEKVLEGVQS